MKTNLTTIGIMTAVIAVVVICFLLPEPSNAAEERTLRTPTNYPLVSVERAQTIDKSEMVVVGKASEELQGELLSIYSRRLEAPQKILKLVVVWDDLPTAARIYGAGYQMFLVQTERGWVISRIWSTNS